MVGGSATSGDWRVASSGATDGGARITRVGVVAALPAEARTLVGGRVRIGVTRLVTDCVLVRVSGVGAPAARRASEALLAEGAGALISWGIAAALDDTLDAGTIVVADRVVTPTNPAARDGSRSAGGGWRSVVSWADHVAAQLEGRVAIARGTIVSPDQVLRTSADKRALARTGAVAADMESAAVAEVAERAAVPWIAVRAIADRVSVALPLSVVESMRPGGQLAWPQLVLSLLRRPGDIRYLPALASGYRRALRSLEIAAGLVTGDW